MRAALFALALGGCATTPPEPVFPQQTDFGPEQSFTGRLGLGFERQSFDNCWLRLSGTSGSDLARLAPSPALTDERLTYEAEVTLVGRRRGMVNVGQDGPVPYGYGHLNMYVCEIEATRIVSARLLSG